MYVCTMSCTSDVSIRAAEQTKVFSPFSSWPPISSGHCSLNPIEPGVHKETPQWRRMVYVCMCVYSSASAVEQCEAKPITQNSSGVWEALWNPLAALSPVEDSRELWTLKHSAGWLTDKQPDSQVTSQTETSGCSASAQHHHLSHAFYSFHCLFIRLLNTQTDWM